nr:cell wall integrity transcriptional regulator cas5 [Quercus suber]
MSMQMSPARHSDMQVPSSNTAYSDNNLVHQHSYGSYVSSSSVQDQSRRPSLAFSALSDPSSSVLSAASISLPVTPINGRGPEMQWSDTAPSYVTQTASFHSSAPLFQAPFEKQGSDPDHGSSNYPVFAPSLSYGDQEEFLNQFGLGSSNAKLHGGFVPYDPRQFNHPRAAQYQRTEGLDHDMFNAMLCESAHSTGQMLPSQNSMAGLAINDFDDVADPYHQSFESTIQSSSGLPLGSYHELSTPDQDRHLPMAFDYGMTELESFHAHDLADTYLGDTRGGFDGQLRGAERSCTSSPTCSSSSLQPKRTMRRRTRNNVRCQVYHVGSEAAPIEVVDEAQLSGGEDGRPKIPHIRSTRKLHFCKWIDADGKQCDGRFERSEHLKRHYGKHSNERPFACRLPGCTKRIQRGDNAGDHFKSHLKGPRPGQRNGHFEWPDLQRSIQSSFEPKVADKLCKNIRRWILQNHEGESQRKYLTGG